MNKEILFYEPPAFTFSLPEQPEPYRGFPIQRLGPYFLYEIIKLEGYMLPARIDGSFTKLELLHTEIDKYLEDNPNATADNSYIPANLKRHVGRPAKLPPAHVLLEAHGVKPLNVLEQKEKNINEEQHDTIEDNS
jgi:hypothetical protein